MYKTVFLCKFGLGTYTILEVHQTLVIFLRLIHSLLVVCFGILITFTTRQAARRLEEKGV
jgi:hypothetical protein